MWLSAVRCVILGAVFRLRTSNLTPSTALDQLQYSHSIAPSLFSPAFSMQYFVDSHYVRGDWFHIRGHFMVLAYKHKERDAASSRHMMNNE